MKSDTRSEIENIGRMREKVEMLEKKGIPRQRDEFEELRQDISELLDDLLMANKISMQASHLIRTKLQRIDSYFQEMGMDSEDRLGEDHNLERDKETQDSKLHVVQLMLSQIFPHLKQVI